MKEKLYSPWKSKMKAQKNEESKFQRALKPFPKQSSMQGRESEKESNIQQFCIQEEYKLQDKEQGCEE